MNRFAIFGFFLCSLPAYAADESAQRWPRLTIGPPVFGRTPLEDGAWKEAFAVTERLCPGDNVAANSLQFRVKTKQPEEALAQVSGDLNLMEKQAEIIASNCPK
jgi:hypothetical protein